MTPEHDAKLRADYPLVFQKPLMNGEPIRCGDGWYHLLNNLCRILQQTIEGLPEDQRGRYAAAQVKEKFGALRFYLEDDNPESPVARWIRGAEVASLLLCDVCGAAGQAITHKHMIATRCAEHAGLWVRP